MATEIETKVLDIDAETIKGRLTMLGATKILDTRFTVDWYRLKGVKEGEDPWFLRIRSTTQGISEVTWKAKSDIIGTARKHKEINFVTETPEEIADLLQEIGLEKYAHQEKDRISFTYEDWQFDIDIYPGMSAFLEIEGTSEEHIKEAMKLLDVSNNRTWPQGERTLIQQVYNLDWYNMKF